MDRSQAASGNLMDTHERLIADILTRYRALLMLATIQAAGDRANDKPEAIAVAGISMKMEFDGLYASIKELLTLSRRMKELWVFGPLGKDDQGAKAREEEIDSNVHQVAGLLSKLEETNMKELAEKSGATWEPLKEEASTAVGGEAQSQPQQQQPAATGGGQITATATATPTTATVAAAGTGTPGVGGGATAA